MGKGETAHLRKGGCHLYWEGEGWRIGSEYKAVLGYKRAVLK